MTVSISIDPADPHDLDSLSEDEDSSGVQVSIPSDGSHEYADYDDEWAHLSYPDELLKPSDSASRPRTSNRNRSLHGSRSASARRQPPRRQMIPDRDHDYAPRSRRQPSPESPDSADSEEFAHYSSRNTHERRWAGPPGPGYTQSVSSGPTYNHQFPQGQGHAPFPHQNPPPLSDQLIRLGHGNPNGQPYNPAAYPYGPPHGAHPMHPYFQEQGPARHPQQPHQSRIDPHTHQPLPPHMGPHGIPAPFAAGPPFHHEIMPYASNGYFNNFRDPYAAMFQGMMPPSYFNYPQVPSPIPPESKSPPPAPPADDAAKEAAQEAAKEAAAKDEAIARLEKLIMEDRTERENREAARKAAIAAEEAEKAAREKQAAHDRAIAAEAALEAATLARADAEARAATDAAKAKEEAEKRFAEAAAQAKEDSAQAAQDAATKALEAVEAAKAAAAAAAAKAKEEEENKNKVPPPEKKKPIKFKDAVGRKFSFPFELCSTWRGMEDLIKQAFLHIEVIGPHVAEGHYDLVGPNGDIILPQVWETVVEPDWTITMHMWPIPEKPKEPDPPAADAPPAEAPKPAEPKKKEGTKKAPRKPGDPPAFATWMIGRRPPPRVKKGPKVEKKEELAPQ
ncbi:hypothetical protein N7520_000338 [Penicillium odoratum]|uniref:uncharacterized protein n=1 Tax=Penicillium odoratum TaxID=1167516 RepID=UPI002547BF89|nr:uncharacterized protein N7520_000338 [Penicillium odoratum]KAJ5777092.1 hypothetical protein N7520_000338 [Penicillium odoratum]